MLLMGRIFAVVVSCLTCYVILAHTKIYEQTIGSLTAPLLAVAVLAFIGSSMFLSLHSDAAEAIYICYLLEADLGGDWNCPADLRTVFNAITRPDKLNLG